MSTFKWSSYNTADTAVASTSLNALANGSNAIGAAIDNTSGLYLYGDLAIQLSSTVTPTGMPAIPVWLVPSLDGTNYATSGSSVSANLLVGTITAAASVTTSVLILRGIVLTPGKFKIQIQNNLGVAFPATNTSTCSLYRYYEQAV